MIDVYSRTHFQESAAAIREHTSHRPKVALVLGSGLNSLADALEAPDIVPYGQIPHWPASTVPGHSGRLLFGRLEGKELLFLQGRAHLYEGYSMGQITLPVRVLAELGIETYFATNAAGGINPRFSAGDLMLISDHLNFPGLAGSNPLRGLNDESLGPRFPDMTFPYDPELRAMARSVAEREGIELQEGVYAYVAGPSFETPAELRYLRTVGADAVGMSTVPSVVVARHMGLRVIGISTITNMAKLEPVAGETVTHEEVLEVGARATAKLARLLRGIIPHL